MAGGEAGAAGTTRSAGRGGGGGRECGQVERRAVYLTAWVGVDDDVVAVVAGADEARRHRAPFEPGASELGHDRVRQVRVHGHTGNEPAVESVAARHGVVVDLVLRRGGGVVCARLVASHRSTTASGRYTSGSTQITRAMGTAAR